MKCAAITVLIAGLFFGNVVCAQSGQSDRLSQTFEAGRDSGYLEGLSDSQAAAAGVATGAQTGREQAIADASQGKSVYLYIWPALIAAAAAATAGVLSQYILLSLVRKAVVPPQFLLRMLVPGIDRSELGSQMREVRKHLLEIAADERKALAEFSQRQARHRDRLKEIQDLKQLAETAARYRDETQDAQLTQILEDFNRRVREIEADVEREESAARDDSRLAATGERPSGG